MRTSLSKHLNEFVLCRGWIGVWEDFPYSKTRRITVNQPTITKPNKRLLFKDQEVISTENHLNLFVKFEDLINYDTRFFELNEPIHFSGMVEHYTRKDGSNDFGIYATKQSTIVFEVEKLKRAIVDCNTFGDKEFLINYAYNKVQELIKDKKVKKELSLEQLVKLRLAHKNDLVKILGSGKIDIPIKIIAHKFSASAKKAIEAAGGQAVVH